MRLTLTLVTLPLLGACSALPADGPLDGSACRHVNAQPLSPDDSWSAIQRRAGYFTEIPKVQLGNTFVPVTGICVDGPDLRTIKQVERCTAYRSRGDDDECVATENAHLRTSIAYTREVCTRWRGGENDECARTEARSGNHPTVYEIPVHATRNAGEGEEEAGRLCFVKTHTLPACDT
ncbi:MAG: hypothetical protein ACE366_04135 [Bradymonadia bacterium]